MEDVIGDLDSKLMLKQVALDSRLFKAEGTLSAVCRRLDRLHAGAADPPTPLTTSLNVTGSLPLPAEAEPPSSAGRSCAAVAGCSKRVAVCLT